MLKSRCHVKTIQWFASNAAKGFTFFHCEPKFVKKVKVKIRQQNLACETVQSSSSTSVVLYASNPTTKTMAALVEKADITGFRGTSFIIKTSPIHARHFKFQIGDSHCDISEGDLEPEGGSSCPEQRSAPILDSAELVTSKNSSPLPINSERGHTAHPTASSAQIIPDALQCADTDFEFFSAFNMDHSDTVSSILRADRTLQEELSSIVAEDKLLRCYVHDHGVFKLKGFFIPCEQMSKHEQKLTAIRKRFSALNFRMTRRDQRGGIFVLKSSTKKNEKCYLFPSGNSRPPYHPLYVSETTKHFNSVYHRYEDAISTLNQNLDIPEVVQLLDIAQEYIDPRKDLQSRLKHPFIVIEGLDASGKSTLTENLSDLLGACRLRTPPDSIRNLRQTFDALPEVIRRAYYCLGNYIVAKEVAEKCKQRPVIMDRFWHSTTAYAIANDCDYDDITNVPPIGHWVYQWPSDLLKPTVVLLLSVSEEIREKRMAGRNEVLTWEEKLLSTKAGLFRKKLLEAYRRMVNPPCVEIDAGVSREEVAARSREALKNAGVI